LIQELPVAVEGHLARAAVGSPVPQGGFNRFVIDEPGAAGGLLSQLRGKGHAGALSGGIGCANGPRGQAHRDGSLLDSALARILRAARQISAHQPQMIVKLLNEQAGPRTTGA
jgi:hypothetical protein